MKGSLSGIIFAILMLVLVGGSIGCSVKKDLDKMMDTTEEMADTTKQMKKSTEQLKHRTEDLYEGSREVMGADLLRSAFKQLLAEDDVNAKIDQALYVFGALEFQHWQGDYEDDRARRERLMDKAVDMIFSRVTPWIDDSFPVNEYFPDNHWKSLGAVAVAMSKVHPIQEHLAEQLGFQPYSFYDILVEGLLKKEAYENGEEVPSYVERVLEHEEKTIYLLQLRHNMFNGLLIGTMSAFEDGFWVKVEQYLFQWQFDYQTLNVAEARKWSEWAWKGYKTIKLLDQLGVEPEYNGLLRKVQSHLNVIVSDPYDFSVLDQPFDLSSPEPQGIGDPRKEFLRRLKGFSGGQLFIKSNAKPDKLFLDQSSS